VRKTRPRRRPQRRTGVRRLLPLVLVAAIVATAVYALTATLSIGGTVQAGSGSTTPVTPTITSMQFQYDSNTPLYISGLTLNFSASVTEVHASLAGTWSSSCTGSGSGPWTCTWSSAPSVSAMNANKTLQVVAA